MSEKAGINAEQAKTAVNTVMDFIKNKVPGVGDKIKELIASGGDGGRRHRRLDPQEDRSLRILRIDWVG